MREYNPYEGPEPCMCEHDYGKHLVGHDIPEMPCGINQCGCERFEPYDPSRVVG